MIANRSRPQRASTTLVPLHAVRVLLLVLVLAAVQLGSVTTQADAATVIKLDGTATKSFALNSTTTMGIAVPSGTRAGDVLVASVGIARSSATSQPAITAPSGWTLASRTNYSSTSALAVYTHAYATTDTSYTWTSNAAVGGGVEVSAFSGVDPVTPLAGSQGTTVTRTASVPTPSLTAAAGSGLVASYFGYLAKAGTTTWTSPKGMSSLGQLNDSTKRTAMLAAYVAQATTGSTGAKTATASRTQDVGIGVLTALKPAPSPPVVSAVAVTASTPTSLTVGWTTDIPASSQVDYGTTSSYGSSTTLDSTLATQHSQTITGLTAATAYHYRVRSTANGQTTVSADNTGTTATAPPAAPVVSAVTVTASTSTSLTVGWTTDIAADSQIDYGTTSSYGSSTTLDPTLATQHSQTITGLTAATAYHFRVRSTANGQTTVSADNIGTTATAPPAAPVVSAVSVTASTPTSLTVGWTTDIPASSQIDYGTTVGYGSSTTLDPTLATQHSQTISGLTAATAYHFRVRSTANGQTTVSADNTGTTATAPPAAPVVSAVTVTASTPTSLTVGWTTDIAADSQIDYGTTVGYGSSTTLDPTLATQHSQTISGLTAATAYHFRVRSTANGQTTVSADNIGTTATAPPAAPVVSAVSVTASTPTSLTVGWTTDIPASSQIDYGTTVGYGSSTTLDPTLATQHSQTISGLTAATAYHFRVRSTANGQTTVSADNTGTTATAPPAAPVVSAVTVTASTPTSLTVGWTTDIAADSQIDYGTTASYGSSTTLDPTLATQHSQTITGLTAATAYHFRVRSTANGQTTVSADNTGTTATPSPPATPSLIVDTDMFSDADDAGALAVAFGLQLKGEAKVIAINVNTRTDRPVVAKESWGCVEAIAQFYGATNIPIGADGPANGTAVSSPDWATPCANAATQPLVQPDAALTVYRRALAAQPDGSVVIASTGFLENLSALLNSPPDAISPLSGHDLVAAKVRNLVIMGGQFPSGSAQTNLAGNVAASQNVVANWPTKIVWAGSEVGDAIHTGNTVSQVHPSSSPVRAAYEAFVGPNNWIYSYDLAAVYAAIRPTDPALSPAGPGTNVVDSTGGNAFTAGAGNQYYLQLNNATSIDASIEGLLDTLPAQLPPAGPVISGQQATAIGTQAATVTWTTNVVADSQVQYGTTTSYGSSSLLNTTLTTSHSVQLAALTPGTTYHCRVLSRDSSGNLSQSGDFTFTTSTGQVSSGPSDTFDTNTLDTSQWIVGTSGSTVAAQNQELEITHPAGAWTTGSVQSATPYDQTGKSVQVQVRRAANAGQGGTTYGETSIFITLDSTHYAEFFLAGGAATAWVNSGSGETNLTPAWPRYDANAMQWFRFRESGGTLYWETASGTSAPGPWSVLASAPDPFPMTQTTFKIVAGSNTTTNDVASFDNVSTN
ncbi:fibronectin type III domain-containing protein [Streptacidiphilus rugosus]|uniref:fibronectin type III domain-containing protein n=1 Tax=Streptacidiphilus rugosus TaxID=405783 RepID=UPI00068BF1B4|nr:fibronectin type III domain-containing protein [Streptacidiphilus rugosus]